MTHGCGVSREAEEQRRLLEQERQRQEAERQAALQAERERRAAEKREMQRLAQKFTLSLEGSIRLAIPEEVPSFPFPSRPAVKEQGRPSCFAAH